MGERGLGLPATGALSLHTQLPTEEWPVLLLWEKNQVQMEGAIGTRREGVLCLRVAKSGRGVPELRGGESRQPRGLPIVLSAIPPWPAL